MFAAVSSTELQIAPPPSGTQLHTAAEVGQAAITLGAAIAAAGVTAGIPSWTRIANKTLADSWPAKVRLSLDPASTAIIRATYDGSTDPVTTPGSEIGDDGCLGVWISAASLLKNDTMRLISDTAATRLTVDFLVEG